MISITHLDKDARSGRKNVVSSVLSLDNQVVAASLLVIQRLLQSDQASEI